MHATLSWWKWIQPQTRSFTFYRYSAHTHRGTHTYTDIHIHTHTILILTYTHSLLFTHTHTHTTEVLSNLSSAVFGPKTFLAIFFAVCLHWEKQRQSSTSICSLISSNHISRFVKFLFINLMPKQIWLRLPSGPIETSIVGIKQVQFVHYTI